MVRTLLVLLVLLALPARAQDAAPHAIDIPPWFSETFLDVREDALEAAREGKRLMIYFGQDGCPYCTALMQTNFTQPGIVAKTRKHFTAIALNIWGDREVTWTDGRAMTEKDFARVLRVQFTPTLLFLDEKGGVVLRLNGYYPPHRLEPALDYVAGRMETKLQFADYMKRFPREPAAANLHDQPFFGKPPHDLRRKRGAKPLAVIFETPYCSGCDELHKEGFARAEVKAELAGFDIVRFSLFETTTVTAPDGKAMPADRWARSLKIAYTPSIVFFGTDGREAFRSEAYMRPFHLAGSFAYVSSGAYRSEPSFQRFLQARAERARQRGQAVDLWK